MSIVWLMPGPPTSASPKPSAVVAGQPDRNYVPRVPSLPIPADAKKRLLALTPGKYTGLAAALAKRV